MQNNYSTPLAKVLPKEFRLFCIEKWYEHKDEILEWTGQPLTKYDDKYYFSKHKWLLKRMFKESRGA